jgi:hypoxanthine phosphoribosyltransferase
MKKLQYTMGQFLLDIRLLADKLREYNPTAIVAPIRGALVPAGAY